VSRRAAFSSQGLEDVSPLDAAFADVRLTWNVREISSARPEQPKFTCVKTALRVLAKKALSKRLPQFRTRSGIERHLSGRPPV
jgi:hypothetical protein